MGKEQVYKFTRINKLIKICILNSRLVGTFHMLFRSMNIHGDLAYSISQMESATHSSHWVYIFAAPRTCIPRAQFKKAVL